MVLALGARDDSLVQRPRDERDRPVTAGGRVAGVVEEHDAEVGTVVVRLDDVAAIHVGVAAWLVDEQPPHVVEAVERVASLVEDGTAQKRLDPGRDDAERLAAGVVVDSADLHASTLQGSEAGARGSVVRRGPSGAGESSTAPPGGAERWGRALLSPATPPNLLTRRRALRDLRAIEIRA